MSGMMPKKGNNNIWQYPSSADVLEKAGLHTIEHYIDVRRQTIAAFIVNRPIFELCTEGERKRGSSANRQFWWQQTFNLEEARAAGCADAIAATNDEEEG